MSTEPEQQDQEPLPIQYVQTVELLQEAHSGQYRATVTEAVRAAGLNEGATFQFKPYEIEELGVLPALGASADENAPRDRYTRTATTDGKASIRLTLPTEVVEALESQAGREHDSEHPLLLDVFAGERLLAFAPAEGIDVPIEALPEDPDRVVDDSRDVLRLEPVQTARPRVKVMGEEGQSRMAQLTATTAIRAAGLTSEVDKPYSVSYHPEAADSLAGLIPAVGYQRQASVTDPEYSIYREQGGGSESQPEVYSIGLPAAVAEVLGTSIDELEELSRRERPEVAVYAAEGILGFKTPTVREIQVERDRMGELTDVAGIGEAVADRLRERGYESPEDLVGITREELLEIEGLSSTRVDQAHDDLSTRSGGT
jgi:predicted flap endonuclease-1-like 5' DNA nuclease